MTKKILVFIIPLLFVFTFAVPALAQYGLSDTAAKAGYQQSDVYALVGQIINAFLSLLAIIFFGVMIYAGMRWMTARGQEDLVKKAKTALEAGIIGLIITISAYGISNFVISRLAK